MSAMRLRKARSERATALLALCACAAMAACVAFARSGGGGGSGADLFGRASPRGAATSCALRQPRGGGSSSGDDGGGGGGGGDAGQGGGDGGSGSSGGSSGSGGGETTYSHSEVLRLLEEAGAAAALNATQRLDFGARALRLHLNSSEWRASARARRAAALEAEASAAATSAGNGAGASGQAPGKGRSGRNSDGGGGGGGKTRGVLIVAGKRDMMANALITVRVLRGHLGCTLPIEVVYFGAPERDNPAAPLLEREAHVRLIDGGAAPRPGPHHPNVTVTGGFWGKAFALCYVTSFDEALLLDVDNLPVADPTPLFDSAQFVRHGIVAWPDFWERQWMAEEAYTRFGLEAPWRGDPRWREAESGMLMLDRARHADAVEWIWFLNAHKDAVYKMMNGDKDTYRLAFFLAGKGDAFYSVPHLPRDGMRHVPAHEHPFHHKGMLHMAPDGAPAFFHRTAFNSKFFPDCLLGGENASHVDYVSVPLTPQQARDSFKAHLFAWDAARISTTAWAEKCKAKAQQGKAGDKGGGVDPDRPDAGCTKELGIGNDTFPIPVIPVSEWRSLAAALRASYEVFAEVRRDVGARSRLQRRRRQASRLLLLRGGLEIG